MPDAGITRLRFSIAMPYAKTMARVSIAMSNAKTLARVSLIILSTLLLAGCSDTTEEAAGKSPGGNANNRRQRSGNKAAIPVKAQAVVRGDMDSYIETYARLEAERKVSVLVRTTGLVEELAAEEGDIVRAGQIMVRLDRAELNLQHRQAQTNFTEAESGYERLNVLHAKQMVSSTEYEAGRLKYENAKVALEESQFNLAHTDIKAPIAGVVTQRSVELGQLVQNNQEIFVIADMEPLLVRIFVPERRMYQLTQGQQTTLTAEALPGQVFDGLIRMISPEVDQQSGTVKVTIEVPADGLLKPGMFTTVRIITERRPQTLIVPKKAMIIETDQDDVFVVVDGKVHQTLVELGFIEDNKVEIVSGLEEGQLVVTVGHDGLKDGTAVRIVGAPSPEHSADQDSSASNADQAATVAQASATAAADSTAHSPKQQTQ
jgi:membrane fusion protein (multidrug efflux system)